MSTLAVWTLLGLMLIPIYRFRAASRKEVVIDDLRVRLIYFISFFSEYWAKLIASHESWELAHPSKFQLTGY